jgi:hypothetical protein
MDMIRKGIQGINKLRREDPAGWHVFLKDNGETVERYFAYRPNPFSIIVQTWDSNGYDLEGVTGNGLYFVARKPAPANAL